MNTKTTIDECVKIIQKQHRAALLAWADKLVMDIFRDGVDEADEADEPLIVSEPK